MLAIPAGLSADPQQAVRTFEGVAEQLARVPGVTSVGISSSITMDGEDNGNYAAFGIYGVVAYAAAQRTREIGVRMALGAQTGDVRRLFLRHGLWLTGIGIAFGIGIALILTRVMSAFLFGVGPMDPITYAAVSAVLAGLTLAATYLPAHRASRVDPVVALRVEA